MKTAGALSAVTFEPRQAVLSFLSEYEYGSPKTLAFYRDQVGRVLLGFLEREGVEDIADVTPDMLRAYMVEQAHLSNGSVGQRYQAAHRFFNWCVEQSYIDANPMKKIRRPKRDQRVRESFTREEVDRMWVVLRAKGGWTGVRDRTIVTCLLGLGCRAAELLTMKWSDIDWQHHRITLHGKGSKDRRERMGSNTFKALREWQRTVRETQRKGRLPEVDLAYVWMSQRGAMTYGALEMMVRHLGEYADVDNCILHRFRHTFATEHYRANRDILMLKHDLGHEDVNVTMKYLARLGVEYDEGKDRKTPDEWLLP